MVELSQEEKDQRWAAAVENMIVRGYDIMEYLTRQPTEPGKEREFAMTMINGRATIDGIPNDGFKVGDWVKDTWTNEDAGEVTRLKTFAVVQRASGEAYTYDISRLELAERPKPKPTQEQAWTELPILVAELIKDKAWVSALSKDKSPVIYETERTEIRHQAYILLGGANPRINITDEVKERVRDVIERMAAILGVRYL